MLEAFAALEPGRAELTRVAHERGWTGVRLDLPLALRFAPLLARELARVVLVWTVDADHCRVSLFEPGGRLVEASHPDQLENLVHAFHAAHPSPDIGTASAPNAVPEPSTTAGAPDPPRPTDGPGRTEHPPAAEPNGSPQRGPTKTNPAGQAPTTEPNEPPQRGPAKTDPARQAPATQPNQPTPPHPAKTDPSGQVPASEPDGSPQRGLTKTNPAGQVPAAQPNEPTQQHSTNADLARQAPATQPNEPPKRGPAKADLTGQAPAAQPNEPPHPGPTKADPAGQVPAVEPGGASGSAWREAVELGGSPRRRHVALAAVLGVPDTVPGSGREPGRAPVIGGERRFRRQRRVRTARDLLHFASAFGLIAALGFVLRGPWVGIVVALGVVGVLQLARFGLGRIRV